MLSDAKLTPEVANDPKLRQYTGQYDVMPALRAKTAGDYPYMKQSKVKQIA
jgi:hypothetical protein